MNRVRNLKLVLWMLAGFGFAVGLTRFFFGLGATTNLGDGVPWGLWIGFDVMSGVALAGGGFVMTAIVYIFGREEYHPIVRPAVLTAFLGYVAVIFGLLFDLGLPWNIWHMIVFWNPHSPLFEVGWCVMLYTTVLLLEFSPVPMESSSAWAKIRATLIKIRIPLVITGIALSTLHQSSLGTLFMIMPYRVPVLWYSPILPILFFISAIGLGMLMVTFESHFTSYFYRRKPEIHLLKNLAGWSRWVLLLYLSVRIGDLAVRGQLDALTAQGWRTVWFWVEIVMMVGAPLVFFSVPKLRISRTGQWTGATLGVSGIVLNRINVGGFVHLDRGAGIYLPSFAELAITLAVVATLALIFLFFLERFHVWEERPVDPNAKPEALPEFDYASMVSLGAPSVASRYTRSLAFILAAALGFALLSDDVLTSKGFESNPVRAARGGDTLWVDGNRDNYGVAFPHSQHVKFVEEILTPGIEITDRENGGVSFASETEVPQYHDKAAICSQCHHMNLPGDQASGCYECHSDMYNISDSFGHDWHSETAGAGLSCFTCHQTGMAKNAESAKQCNECHDDLVPAYAAIEVEQYLAPGYTDAMHGMCQNCHKIHAEEVEKADLGRCTTCHTGQTREVIKRDQLNRWSNVPNNDITTFSSVR
ncbi:Ni/Fe-hydrogenase cytochrome b subunit [bacterium]|nr:Ni/Fe-hydrogenase cytochrome b subunit [bacterium]